MKFIAILICIFYLVIYSKNQSTIQECEFKDQDILGDGVKFNSSCSIIIQSSLIQNNEFKFPNSSKTQNIEALKFIDNDLPTVPHGIATYFPRLKALVIYNSNLKKISSKDLKDLTNLEFINLNRNFIEILEENLFQFNPKLTHILIKRNQIRSIDPTIFAGLKNLKVLDLSNNICTSLSSNLIIDILELKDKVRSSCWISTEISQRIHKIENKIDDKKLWTELILVISIGLNVVIFSLTVHCMRLNLSQLQNIKATMIQPPVQNNHYVRQNLVRSFNEQNNIYQVPKVQGIYYEIVT